MSATYTTEVLEAGLHDEPLRVRVKWESRGKPQDAEVAIGDVFRARGGKAAGMRATVFSIVVRDTGSYAGEGYAFVRRNTSRRKQAIDLLRLVRRYDRA